MLCCEFCLQEIKDEKDARWVIVHKDVTFTEDGKIDHADITLDEHLACPSCCDGVIERIANYDVDDAVKDKIFEQLRNLHVLITKISRVDGRSSSRFYEELKRLDSRIDELEDDISKVRDDVRDDLSLSAKIGSHVLFRNGELILKNARFE